MVILMGIGVTAFPGAGRAGAVAIPADLIWTSQRSPQPRRRVLAEQRPAPDVMPEHRQTLVAGLAA